MSDNKLHIAEVAPIRPGSQGLLSREGRREQIQATMERDWLQDPEQFDPERNCVEQQRIDRTVEAIKSCIDVTGKRCVDLGCGGGVLTRRLRDLGADRVDAVDVASQALKRLEAHDMNNIRAIKDCLPATRLNDSDYDIVNCTEVIGYLEPREYRLLFAELSRLVKFGGIVVCSTPLDPASVNPLEMFSQLADTEFEPLLWSLSYHRSFQRLCKVFPGMKQSKVLRNFLEKISQFFLGPESASHVLFIGKRRPLTFPLPPNEVPKERPGKRQVWE